MIEEKAEALYKKGFGMNVSYGESMSVTGRPWRVALYKIFRDSYYGDSRTYACKDGRTLAEAISRCEEELARPWEERTPKPIRKSSIDINSLLDEL